ncbi:DUF3883 domain-containing protein [Pseudomonas nitroreducens]|uniref:DUF3883 domain-containing protein n=1 Tax=Pseudomonas nitroreducens TaxID=46680 RepID=UPI00351D7D52
MSTLSPGLAQGCFELLRIVSCNPLRFPEIHASFTHLGTLPVAQVILMAQRVGWLCASDEGYAVVTPSGTRLLSISGYKPMLRQALLDYMNAERPPWIQNATSGRLRVIRFAGSEIAQVFIEAGLAHGVEDDVVTFWDTVAALARGQKSDRLSDVGRKGERLSIAYELARTGSEPRWVAIDSNEDGYDLLSIVELNDVRPLSIEVKASTRGLAGSLHLTRNEWDRCQELGDYVFHLWDLKSKGNFALAVITPDEMRNHIPTDSGVGSWESVEVPFGAFGSFISMHELGYEIT